MTEPHITISDTQNLEFPLKTILENILVYLEKLVTSQTEITLIENKLHDYESVYELVEIIKDIWSFFTLKLNEKLELFDDRPTDVSQVQEEYKKLEESLQKHESQIRNHIAIEQQLRLCAETFQAKAEEITKTLEKEKMQYENDTKNLKEKLLESQDSINSLKKTLQLYEKTLDQNEKVLDEMRKKLLQPPVSDEKRANSHKNQFENDASPLLKGKTHRLPENFVNIKDYLRIRNEKKTIKSNSLHKFEEIPLPPKAFADLSHIYGNSLKNILKAKPVKKKLNQVSQLPLQNHIINMNFPKNPLIMNNSGQNFHPKNTTNLNINVTNMTNSLIVNQNASNNPSNQMPYIQKTQKPRRSKSQGNFNKIGIQGLGVYKVA